jgi:hypothetical protein
MPAMIEPTQAVKKPLPDIATKDVARPEQEARDDAAASAAAELQVAERQKQVAASSPGFDVRLDGETMRLYSELRDPETDRVIVRLPTGYQPENEAPPKPPSISTEA